MTSTRTTTPLVVIGIILLLLSIFILIYLTVTDGFWETLFPTGISSIIIGWLGLKLFRIGRKSESAENASHEKNDIQPDTTKPF